MKWPWSVTAKGFAMGVADLVPGVSGGTVAFISGVYDPLLNSLSAISGEGFQALKRGHIVEAWNAINGRFLLALGAGIVLAIATLASPLHWLLEHEPVLLRAFFMGSWPCPFPWWEDMWGVGAPMLGFGRQWVAPCGICDVLAAPGPIQPPPVVDGLGSACHLCHVAAWNLRELLAADSGAYAPVLLAVKTLDVTKIAAFGIGALLGLLTFSRALKVAFGQSEKPHLGGVDWVFGGFASGALALEGPNQTLVHPQRRQGGMDAGKHLALRGQRRPCCPDRIGR